MTADTLMYIALGVAALLWVSLRQLTWRPADPVGLAKQPVVLVAGGLFVGWKTWDVALLGGAGPLDALVILLELAVAIAAGVLMGRVSDVAQTDVGPRFRLRPVGLLMWFGVLAVRLGLTALALFDGLRLASSSALILVMIGVVKAAQAVVVHRRATTLRSAALPVRA